MVFDRIIDSICPFESEFSRLRTCFPCVSRFNFPVEMIASIKKAMKPNGELFLIEYRGEDSFVPIKKIHKMTQKQAVKEFEAAGLFLKENIKNLPWQHCMIFVKKLDP